jgi:hypothetical protein
MNAMGVGVGVVMTRVGRHVANVDVIVIVMGWALG